MPLTERENYLRSARSEGPEWIPISIVLPGALWLELGEELEDVVSRHPAFFPNFEKGRRDFSKLDYRHRKDNAFRDAWGCLWENAMDGVVGQVLEHPLLDWSAFETFRPPDPLSTDDHLPPPDWNARRASLEKAKAEGRLASGALPHGFFFMRLYYLRGFENLMLDIGLEEPRLRRLIDVLVEHNRVKVGRWLELAPDVMHFPDDLGTQIASMISPRDFAGHCTPVYRELMRPCGERGVLVHMHSDGHVVELADELFRAGVDIINPQDLCNGIDEIKRTMKGRFCIDLDVDRQDVIPFGTRREIRELIELEVRELGSPQGGLMMKVGIYPPTPPENVDALLAAFEEFRTYWG